MRPNTHFVPRLVPTGGKPKLLGISKRGNPYLRTSLIHGARAILYCVKNEGTSVKKWVMQLHHRKHEALPTVGLAKKLARIAWALMNSKTVYSKQHGSVNCRVERGFTTGSLIAKSMH